MTEDEEYPSDDDLAFIKNFDCTKNDVRVLIDRLEELWWNREWGFVRTTKPNVLATLTSFERGIDRKEDLCLELHTGGWSGNEDILQALKANKWFYLLYWEKSERGGHETFRFTQLDSWKKK